MASQRVHLPMVWEERSFAVSREAVQAWENVWLQVRSTPDHRPRPLNSSKCTLQALLWVVCWWSLVASGFPTHTHTFRLSAGGSVLTCMCTERTCQHLNKVNDSTAFLGPMTMSDPVLFGSGQSRFNGFYGFVCLNHSRPEWVAEDVIFQWTRMSQTFYSIK